MALFPNAKVAENPIQDIVIISLSGHFTQRIQGVVKIDHHCVKSNACRYSVAGRFE
nr:hypothetical protein [Desulfatirhabdium butyrativorans]